MNIDLEKLNSIDLTHLAPLITNNEHRGYFLEKPGREHYKLLSYFSQIADEKTVMLDVGTNRALSALAMSTNPSVQVVSFDLDNYREITGYPKNVEFILDWVTMPKYKNLVMDSSFIFLDTLHDGIFENQFYHYLRSIGWKGILLLDDIKLNQPMMEFWSVITEEKYDVSQYGHWSGTGLVIFE